MTTVEVLRALDPDDPGRLGPSGELQLDPLVHGPARVPGQRARDFDLAAFAVALENRDVAEQLARYAPDADVRVAEPDGTGPIVRDVRGSRAIWSWLNEGAARRVEVTHLVDGGDRVAFTAHWRDDDGSVVVATSTAELVDGLISTQHTLLARTHGGPDPIDGWTRLDKDLWTASS